MRVPCPKCRQHTSFDLMTGAVAKATVVRAEERELRCGKCRGFLAGVKVDRGAGQARIPCTKTKCKRHNSYRLKEGLQPSAAAVPTG
jgi:hypothetical protein